MRAVLRAVLSAGLGPGRGAAELADACTDALVLLRDGGISLAAIVRRAATFFERTDRMGQPRRYDHDTRIIYCDGSGRMFGALALLWYRAEPTAPGEPLCALVYAGGVEPGKPKEPRIEQRVKHRAIAGANGPWWDWPDALGEMGNDGSLELEGGRARAAYHDRPPEGLMDGTPKPAGTSNPPP